MSGPRSGPRSRAMSSDDAQVVHVILSGGEAGVRDLMNARAGNGADGNARGACGRDDPVDCIGAGWFRTVPRRACALLRMTSFFSHALFSHAFISPTLLFPLRFCFHYALISPTLLFLPTLLSSMRSDVKSRCGTVAEPVQVARIECDH